MTAPDAQYDAQYDALVRALLAAPGSAALREQLHARYLELGRGATTGSGLPYPFPDDPVYEGADATRTLAEAIDAAGAIAPPHFVLKKTGGFNFTTTATPHTWDAALDDGALEGWATSDYQTFTCTRAGVWGFAGQITASTANQSLNVELRRNGATFAYVRAAATTIAYVAVPLSTSRRFAAGDTFQILLSAGGAVGGISSAGSTILAVDYRRA